MLRNYNLMDRQHYWQKINPQIENTQLILSGDYASMLSQLDLDLKLKRKPHPFDNIIHSCYSNPLMYNQKPNTFCRDVIAGMLNSKVLQSNLISNEAKERVHYYQKNGFNIGCYSNACGHQFIRSNVAKYLEKQFSIKSSFSDVLLGNGVSQLLDSLFTLYKGNGTVMMPSPSYSLYINALRFKGLPYVCYYIDQQKKWVYGVNQIKMAIQQAEIKPKLLVIINPNNPTGFMLCKQSIQQIIKFAVQNKITILADQVFRDDIMNPDKKFYSFRQVLAEMDQVYQEKCQIISLFSISKGLFGQGGARGAYIELYNTHPNIKQQLIKLASNKPCPNAYGQAYVDMYCNPPPQNTQARSIYNKEIKEVIEKRQVKSAYIAKVINQMPYLHCHSPDAGLDSLTMINFTADHLKKLGDKPELTYCIKALQEVGIFLGPGSVYYPKEGYYIIRIIGCIMSDNILEDLLQRLGKFNKKFFEQLDK